MSTFQVEDMRLLLKAIILFYSSVAPALSDVDEFLFDSIDGGTLNIRQFEGKAVLITNTASRCGFTRQYSDLEKLHQAYKDKGLVVIAVPSNDFNQELSNSKQVKEFCEIRFGVNFPLTKILKVRGDNAHPLYKWIAKNVSVIGTPRWNFHKYLIGKDGNIVNWYSSMTSPNSESLIKEIETALY